MSNPMTSSFTVLIAGCGVAALEAALALRALGGERLRIVVLCPERELIYRPLRVLQPFGGPSARRYPLQPIADDLALELRADRFHWLDAERRALHTDRGAALHYDALLLALGARRHVLYRHALTLDDRLLDEQLHGLLQDIESGYTTRLAFLMPDGPAWPLPLYELALMSARRAWEMGIRLSLTLATPEPSPLAIFGEAASDAVARLLSQAGVSLMLSARAQTPAPGKVVLEPGGRMLDVQRTIALPKLAAASTPGVPKDARGGFLTVDRYCRVLELQDVFAAGDVIDYPVKHGGLAAQQADVAAESIAQLAGLAVKPRPLDPVIHAILLGAERPLYLSARLAGGRGISSRASEEPLWSPPGAKIDARHLAPYLAALDRASGG